RNERLEQQGYNEGRILPCSYHVPAEKPSRKEGFSGQRAYLDTTTGTPDLSGSRLPGLKLCRINPAFHAVWSADRGGGVKMRLRATQPASGTEDTTLTLAWTAPPRDRRSASPRSGRRARPRWHPRRNRAPISPGFPPRCCSAR